MSQQQQELRRAAAEAFIESLEQLHHTFAPADDAAATAQPVLPDQLPIASPEPTAQNECHGFDLNSFEEAIADLEQFIEQQGSDQPNGFR